MFNNITIISGVKKVSADVSKMLAEELDMLVLDTDDYIAYDMEMSINQIIADQGSDFFYTVETAKLKRMIEYEDAVIAPSPTCLLNMENIYNLKKFSYIVLLECDANTEYNRFHRDTSLIMKKYLSKSYGVVLENKARIAEENLADIVIDITGKRPKQIVDEIMAQLNKILS